MITKDKVTEIFCIIDEFEKNLSVELSKNMHLPLPCNDGVRRRNRKGRMSESEIMTILVYYHFGTYRNFKEYYLNCIRGQLRSYFPHAVSYNRFVELMPMWDKIMMRKRYVIECINHLLKEKAYLVHSRHRPVHNFIMNICSALAAYCFFEDKSQPLPVHRENALQLEPFLILLIPNSH